MKVTVLGAGGRMGYELIRGITKEPDLTLVAAVERDGHAAVGQDAGSFAGLPALGISIGADAAAAIALCDVVIDFTFHSAVPQTAALVAKAGKAYIVGTTGLTEAEEAAVRQAATVVPVVQAPNMSMGVNVLLDLVTRAARTLGLDYDAEVIELHHRHKRDAPSGTALALGQAVAAGRNQDLDQVACHGREGITGERPRGEIGFHALRGGDIVGEHTVALIADGERIELSHKASSRSCLSAGALKAAVWIAGHAPGLYSMRDVLGLSQN